MFVYYLHRLNSTMAEVEEQFDNFEEQPAAEEQFENYEEEAETDALAGYGTTAELPEIKLFGRWSCDDVHVSDMSLAVRIFFSSNNEKFERNHMSMPIIFSHLCVCVCLLAP